MGSHCDGWLRGLALSPTAQVQPPGWPLTNYTTQVSYLSPRLLHPANFVVLFED